MNWTQETVTKLIGLYHTKKLLWQPKNLNYYNVALRSEAWTDIAQQMGCTVMQARRKMENLLSQLRREKKKIKAKVIGEKAYQPTWYGYELLSFLHSRKISFRNNRTISMENADSNSGSEDDDDDYAIGQDDDSTTFEVDVEDEPYVMVVCDSNKENPLSEKPVKTEKDSTHSAFDSPPPKIKKITPGRTPEVIRVSAGGSAYQTGSVHPSASTAVLPDESQLYADFIASKFRSYTQNTRNRLQHEISLLLYRADNGGFDRL